MDTSEASTRYCPFRVKNLCVIIDLSFLSEQRNDDQAAAATAQTQKNLRENVKILVAKCAFILDVCG